MAGNYCHILLCSLWYLPSPGSERLDYKLNEETVINNPRGLTFNHKFYLLLLFSFQVLNNLQVIYPSGTP